MPDAVTEIQARRVGNDVYVTLVVPAQNVDQSQPAAVVRVDIYAVTTDGPPPGESFASVAERIASVPVALPPPPPPAGASQPPTRSAAPPVPAPGGSIAVRETLDAAALAPKVVASTPPAGRGTESPAPPVPAAESASLKPGQDAAGARGAAPTPAPGPRRYYMAIAVNDRDRSIGRGVLASVPAGAPPAAPAGVDITFTEGRLLVSWTAVPGASGYQVYEDRPAGAAPGPSPVAWQVAAPTPLNGAMLPTPAFSEPVEFGRERCLHVRAVRAEAGLAVESEPSRPVACRTPDDHFAPAPPQGLQALTTPDGIALRWLPNSEADLGGYVVLRGRAGDATLQAVTPAPVAQTQYVDRTVTPGVRYVYAIVAVDTHQPMPNRSEPSVRDEATAQ